MRIFLLCLFIFGFILPVFSEEDSEGSYTGKVVIIKVGDKDLTNKQSFKFWRRTLERVNTEEALAVIMDLDTPGGLALDTKDLMVDELWDLQVPSYAFVNDDAISAGALISIATDEIWLTPKSKIGAAAIVNGTGQAIEDTMRAKIESYFEATVETVAEEKGHNPEVVKLMMFVDEDKVRKLGPLKVNKGDLLTLTAKEAMQMYKGKPILGKGIVEDLDELVETLGYRKEDVVEAKQTGFEQLAWHIAAWSPLLILIGIGGAYFEMKAPGFGIGGSISLIAFSIFFFGNYVAGNLAGHELVALFVLGVIFIAIELFVFPSLIFGIIGVLLMAGSLLFSMVDRFDFKDIGKEDIISGDKISWLDILNVPMLYLSLGLLGGIILIFMIMKFLPHVPLPGFKLEREIGRRERNDDLPERVEEVRDYVGEVGVSLMDLRPVGKVEVAGKTLDVITKGEFIKKGDKIRVVAQEQMRTIVERA